MVELLVSRAENWWAIGFASAQSAIAILNLARLHRATLCYSKSIQMLKYSVRLLMHDLRFKRVPIPV